ncbi:MAG: rod shape-determining protein RodA [Candidatus Pacebacteria bacterium]|nr:rod shape-determining protein RodA [Candidatus Paceibacterota bacterium]
MGSSSTQKMDWLIVFAVVPIIAAGLITMKSFTGSEAGFFGRQIIWVIVSFIAFFVASRIDVRFLKRSNIALGIYAIAVLFLVAVLIGGNVVNGAKSWFSFGAFSFQPSDVVKIALIMLLAKYYSRRHVEIRHVKHVIISGLYALVPLFLIFLEPDFGSAIIIFMIWLGMTLVSGISKKHLGVVFLMMLTAFGGLWFFVFKPYQKERIVNFLNPYYDIRGSGYNAYQSRIAVGSGGLLGKGVGFGTQSRLQYLPEYQTDFIFAAFTEEWGFIGAMFLLILYGLLISRIIKAAFLGATNFETLFATGLTIMLLSHILINVGMNIGIMPVTGITLPFMSYGGSHLLVEFIALGLLMGMRRYSRAAHREDMGKEFIGI